MKSQFQKILKYIPLQKMRDLLKNDGIRAKAAALALLWGYRSETHNLHREQGNVKLEREVRTLQRSLRGFTLIEVLVASAILSAVFFAILNLISNNTRQAVVLTHSRTMDELFLCSKACLSSLGYANLLATNGAQSLNFGTDNLGCFTGSYNSNLSFSGINLGYSNDGGSGSDTYWNYFTVVNNTGSLKVTTVLTDGTEKKSYQFTVVP